MPPNCSNKNYYPDLHICSPDSLCQKIKNPVNYSRRKTFYLNKQKKPEDKKEIKDKGDEKTVENQK